MALSIERYALIGDTQTAALVGDDGCLDWLCTPRFDSDAAFAALLGTPEHGRWLIGPRGEVRRRSRRYRPATLVLETVLETDDGALRLTDCMQPRRDALRIARVATCIRGRVPLEVDVRPRLEYGSIRPWTRRSGDAVLMTAGSSTLELRCDVPVRVGADFVAADPALDEGRSAAFVLTWYPSHERPPAPVAAGAIIDDAERFWRSWSRRAYQLDGPWQDAIARSLMTIKALTYAPTGGIVAAPTTSLPECPRGVRNWDYRYCWIRDATFTLRSLLDAGYVEEADAWRDWLLRAVADHPDEMQVLYGPAGERRLSETKIAWLPGYEGSRPVHVGNAAGDQLQLDMYGEIVQAFRSAREAGRPPPEEARAFEQALVEHLESIWRRPDKGIWELRTDDRQLTHSKVMAWRAFDAAIDMAERRRANAPVARWRAVRAEIHADVLAHGYDARRNTFVQQYGHPQLDAALLRIPLVGFLPPTDPRVLGTIEAIQRELCEGGLVKRYVTGMALDGLPPGEGAFLPCSFWMVSALALAGRHDEARALFERLLELRNDVGLLSEEYDVVEGRMLGNFPQVFTHVALVNTARLLVRRGIAR